MNDLISRQAAIDVIEKHIDTLDAIYEDYLDGLKLAMSLLKVLPSAQPEVLACGEGELSVQQEPEHTMEEFMYGQDLGSPEDGSL